MGGTGHDEGVSVYNLNPSHIIVACLTDVCQVEEAIMSDLNPDKEVLTVSEVAALLRVHDNRVREYIRQGKLPALQFVPGGFIRVRKQVVLDMLTEGNINGHLV